MSEMTKPLPAQDMRGVFDAIAVLAGELSSGGVPPVFAAELTGRLAEHGLLTGTTSVGELGAYATDLASRLQYALGEAEQWPVPRRTTYVLSMPSSSYAGSQQRTP